MPESLLAALQRLGHQVDSVNNLKLNGARFMYRPLSMLS